MIFCMAKLPNAGLANRLFPWARCKLFSLDRGVPMLVPAWSQLKLGPALRGETDWRFYRGLFRPAPGETAGIRKFMVKATHDVIPEQAISNGLPGRALVLFEGFGDYFATLNGRNELLHRELRRAVRPQWLARVDSAAVQPIGVHVRRGDFAQVSSANDFTLRGGVRTPIDWFVQTLQGVRHEVGTNVAAFVVSDSSLNDLSGLLRLPDVALLRTGSAISDLLALARAKLLIASGGSSFSAWASFLGDIPAISIPGQSLSWFRLHHRGNVYVGEFDPEAPCASSQRALRELGPRLRVAGP